MNDPVADQVITLHFAHNLRFLRKTRGLTQQQLASELGMNRGNIVSYEKGSAEPNLTNLMKIAGFLRVSVDDILSRKMGQSVSESTETHAVPARLMTPTTLSRQEILTLNDKSQVLGNIIKGISQYYAHRQEQHADLPVTPATFRHDIERCLEITAQIMGMNQMILASVMKGPEDKM